MIVAKTVRKQTPSAPDRQRSRSRLWLVTGTKTPDNLSCGLLGTPGGLECGRVRYGPDCENPDLRSRTVGSDEPRLSWRKVVREGVGGRRGEAARLSGKLLGGTSLCIWKQMESQRNYAKRGATDRGRQTRPRRGFCLLPTAVRFYAWQSYKRLGHQA
ncbi:hypothetical protein V2G26_017619 [Clonostachys chloroleuca]